MTHTRCLEFGLILTFSFLKKICTSTDNIYVGRIDVPTSNVPYTSTVGNKMVNFVKKLRGYTKNILIRIFSASLEFEGVLALLGNKYYSTKFLWYPVYFV